MHLFFFGFAHDLSVKAHQVSDGAVTKQLGIQALPAQQTSDRSKGQILGQQARPFLQTARNQQSLMRRQKRIAGKNMTGRILSSEDLTRQIQSTEATGDLKVSVSVGF